MKKRMNKKDMEQRLYRPDGQLSSRGKGWNTGIYARLSFDSGEEDSLKAQLNLLKKFVCESPELNLVKTYSDQGYTGTNFRRPGWEALMEDIKQGVVNCLVVKDLSRIGRNYLELGDLLCHFFPARQIRVIAVLDRYDNGKDPDMDLLTDLKNMINDRYSRDISKKVTLVLYEKMRKGEFVSSRPAYGYRRSVQRKNQIEVDWTAAKVVQKIFQWRAYGISYREIAGYCNTLLIESPGKYQLRQGILRDPAKENTVWTYRAVHRIIENPVYAGTLAQRKTSGVGNSYQKPMPPNQWISISNHHRPVIEKALFEKTQQRLKQDRQKHGGKGKPTGRKNNYRGFLFCKICNRPLTGRLRAGDYQYVCPNNANGDGICGLKAVGERQLDLVLTSVLHLLSSLGQYRKPRQITKKTEKKAYLHAYEAYQAGLISAQDFIASKLTYYKVDPDITKKGVRVFNQKRLGVWLVRLEFLNGQRVQIDLVCANPLTMARTRRV